jgi:hypothetical protein
MPFAIFRPAQPRNHRSCLRLETLEGREVPSTLTVTNLSDHDPGSFRDELAQAQPGDTIDFADDVRGTILLTSGELRIDPSVSITGPGADQLSVSGNAASRVLEISASADVSITGLMITGGRISPTGTSTSAGAGVLNNGTLTLADCAVSHNNITGSSNSTALGGGIYNAGSLTLLNCAVSANGATGDVSYGGGAWNGNGRLVLDTCTLSDNSANSIGGGYGGGIYSSGGSVTVTNCIFTGNSVARPVGGGGGIYIAAGMATLSDSTLFNNGGSEGSGVHNLGMLSMTACTLSGNHSNFPGGAGGGFYNEGMADLNNCTIAANSVTGNGGTAGGIFNADSGALSLTSCTITGNSAVDRFDGVGGLTTEGSVQLRNTILAGNESAAGKPDVFGAVNSLGYNLVGVTDGSTGWTANDLTGTASSPLDAGLAALSDYGGPTMTMPLQAGSPAIDAGDPALLGTADQRGVVRGGSVNIGAFQATAAYLTITAPVIVTAGTPFDVTVAALDPFGQAAVGCTGTVNLYSTDPAATYLGSHTYTLSDGGVFVFAGVALVTPGPQTLLAADGPLVGLFNLTVQSSSGDNQLSTGHADYQRNQPMMSGHLRALREANPFRPFTIHLADGRS